MAKSVIGSLTSSVMTNAKYRERPRLGGELSSSLFNFSLRPQAVTHVRLSSELLLHLQRTLQQLRNKYSTRRVCRLLNIAVPTEKLKRPVNQHLFREYKETRLWVNSTVDDQDVEDLEEAGEVHRLNLVPQPQVSPTRAYQTILSI